MLPVEPARIETLPEFVTAKSKPLVLENHALASELCMLILKALAFTRASVTTVKGTEYFLEDGVGEVPSIV